MRATVQPELFHDWTIFKKTLYKRELKIKTNSPSEYRFCMLLNKYFTHVDAITERCLLYLTSEGGLIGFVID